ncbi:MAG: PorT family protein [Paludibacteraceae bacterium]|nr:PorT family protein [Paludibacteraceae bacterium]
MKKIIFSIFALFLFASQMSAQYTKYRGLNGVQNLVNVDNKPYHFGFILGLNTMDFNVTNEGSAVVDEEGNVWFADQADMSAGFTVGIISDLRLFEYLNLRFTPALLFGDRTMVFTDKDGIKADQSSTVKSSIINFPLLLKFRGQRSGNYRPYLLGGGSVTWDLARDKEEIIMLKRVDYGVEFGVGCDFYLPYFKLAPELKMYLGLGDVLERNRPEILSEKDLKYTNAISRLTSRLFMLSFNFE